MKRATSLFILAILIENIFVGMIGYEAKAEAGENEVNLQGEADGVAVDSNGDIIVVGQHYDGNKYIMRVQKYDGDSGNIVWQTDFDEFLTNIGKAVAVDSNGYIYAGGIVGKEVAGLPLPSTDYVIVKYDSNGNQLMYQTYNNGFADLLMDMGIDSNGFIYATGMTLYMEDDELTNMDFWTIKVDPTNLELIKEAVFDVATDAAFGMDIKGNEIVVAGSVSNNETSQFCIVRYDDNLNRQWVKYYYNGINASASDAVILNDGKVAVCGFEGNDTDKTDIMVILYDVNRTLLWIDKRQFDGKNDALSIAADSEQNIIVGGYTTGEDKQYHWYLIKYNENGNILWEKKENVIGEIKRITVDENDNIIAVGYKVENGDEIFCIRKYAPDGKLIWGIPKIPP